jgi:hypothetical protein
MYRKKLYFQSVTVDSKNLTNQCNLVAQIEQVQDKILFMTILLMIGSQLLYLAHLYNPAICSLPVDRKYQTKGAVKGKL